MRYLGPSQIEQEYESKSVKEQRDIILKAFGIKEIHPTHSRTDCIAMAMGYEKCISNSGLYENLNYET